MNHERRINGAAGPAHGLAAPAAHGATPTLRLSSKAGGWAAGVGPASLRAQLQSAVGPVAGCEDELRALVASELPRPPAEPGVPVGVEALLYWVAAVLQRARLPVFTAGRTWGADALGRWQLVLPCLPSDPLPTRLAAGWAMRCLFATIDGGERRELTNELLRALGTHAAGDRNTWPFLRAAHELGIPASAVDAMHVQYGHGSRQRRLDSTFTDRTSAVAARAARDKVLAARLLRRAGLPVPEQIEVSGADEAVAAAARLGYPVVVKPVALDGGQGVAAGLRDADAVRLAYRQARDAAQRVLVERHVEGQDHRLMTFEGELIWAIVRHAAAVTGDGRSTVTALLDALNADPRRGRGPGARLQRVDLDDEALGLLAEQGLSPAAVPAPGRVVRLRRTANINRGGIATAVNDRVHPDNRQLALQAAEALDLDIAGVDVLLPDISRSWRETGGAICEVNGQPQLGGNLQRHLHGQMLRALVQGQGRIPVLLLVGAPSALADGVVHGLLQRGLRVGLARRAGAWLHGAQAEPIGQHDRLLSSCAALLSHRRCDALVACVEDDEPLDAGWAFDHADAVAWWAAIGGRSGLQQLLALLRPPGDTRHLLNADDAACRGLPLPAASVRQLPGRETRSWVEALVRLGDGASPRPPSA